MKHHPLALLVALAPLTAVAADDVALDTQTVQADFRNTDVQQIPEAVTVVGHEQIAARSAEHLEQVLSFAPNVNFASGASRGRYYQIRGIGERSQFVDPVNPSVGLLIDGIDMTGLGAAATLFDVQQVEILRGPQGTRFGANALAGMINITSSDPTKNTEGYVSAKAGNYSSYGVGAALSGAVTDDVQARIAVHGFESDGFIHNDYLDRDDTNNQDEKIARAKFAYQPDAQSEVKLTLLYADIDNGYDAFTLDNSRTTLSDQPGRDSQDTSAFALSYNRDLNTAVSMVFETSGSWSSAEYSYDEDWVSDAYPPKWGSAFDQYLRTFERNSADLRFLSAPQGRIFSDSTDWTVGIYYMNREEDLKRNYSSDPAQYRSELSANSVSVYTELSTALSPELTLIYGVRAEQWQNDFSANDGVDGTTDETLFGGKVTLETLLGHNHLGYVSLARGYKPGGINSDPDVADENRSFDTEFNNTAELGVKSSLDNDTLHTRVAVFYIQRKNQQVKSSYFEQSSASFMDYLANAAEGENYGLEVESQWQVFDALRWDISLGYLNAEFSDYSYEQNVYDVDWNIVGSTTVDKSGRSQAHAPEYSVATAVTYAFTERLSLRVESEAKDEFYFSDSHDEKARAAVLWHARLGYQHGPLDIALSGRNLTNRETDVRGFGGFNNDAYDPAPDDVGRYAQLGEPRLVMAEVKYAF
ncbi:TonB-dependent receptor [Thalassolituus sp. LLYu03]|uniref:TonB-dependent receptor n=1 Tax=Thalassolituus sp. LLYu03 TaxID=3421656 RepID=UPI003D2A94FB